MKVINVSGHKVSGEDIEVIYSIPPPFISSDWVSAIREGAEELADEILEYMSDDVVIAIPGHPVLAVALVVAILKKWGRLPVITWAIAPDKRYQWSADIVLDLERIGE